MEAVKTPCPDCPFSKRCTPGALGGSPPSVYIGQARGPFTLPCHKHCDFDDPDWKSKSVQTPQCAGAAIFRTLAGMAGRLPKEIPLLPANSVVFANEYEFLAHHSKTDVARVRKCVNEEEFELWSRIEMVKARRIMSQAKDRS